MAAGLIALAVFAPTTRLGFTDWDDGINVYENPYLNPVTSDGLRALWTRPYENLYVPLVYTSFALDAVAWGGMDPGGFHATNGVIHALVTMVVFRLLLTFVGSVGAALAGSVLFAVHPLQVEPVAWVTGRKDILSGLFSLLAIAGYVRWRRTGRHRWYGIASVAYGAALLSKPAAAAVPLMALAVDVFVLRGPWKRAALSLVPWLLAGGVLVGVTKQAQQPSPYADPDVAAWQRIFVAADALVFYLRKLVWPVELVAIYDRSPFNVLASSRWVYATPAVLILLAVALGRCSAVWRTAGALVLAGVFPVLGLLRFEYQGYSTVADRYFYLSMVGAALAFGAGWSWFSRKPRGHAGRVTGCVVMTAALVALAVLNLRQQRVWSDSLSLWSHNVAIVPDCPGALYNLGVNLSAAGRGGEAIDRFRKAVALKTNYMRARNNLANELMLAGLEHRRQQRYAEAKLAFSEAIEHWEYQLTAKPDDARVYFNAALTYEAAGDSGRAEALYREALEVPPPLAPVHNNLGVLLLQRGRREEARYHFEEALRIDPGNKDARTNFALLGEKPQ